MKSNDVKVMLALGGWTDSSSDKYSRLVNDQTARTRFIDDIIEFLLDNNFDGLDLDWEFPHCWQVYNSGFVLLCAFFNVLCRSMYDFI